VAIARGSSRAGSVGGRGWEELPTRADLVPADGAGDAVDKDADRAPVLLAVVDIGRLVDGADMLHLQLRVDLNLAHVHRVGEVLFEVLLGGAGFRHVNAAADQLPGKRLVHLKGAQRGLRVVQQVPPGIQGLRTRDAIVLDRLHKLSAEGEARVDLHAVVAGRVVRIAGVHPPVGFLVDLVGLHAVLLAVCVVDRRGGEAAHLPTEVAVDLGWGKG
jgi:hypothetical protein